MRRALLSAVGSGFLVVLFAGAALSDVRYEEEVRFATPEGMVTNRFILHAGPDGVRVEESGPRTMIYSVQAGELQVFDRKTGSLSDLSAISAEPRFVQLRESMARLSDVLRHLPADIAQPLHDERIELRRSVRDTMRGVLPWSPCASSVPDWSRWSQAEAGEEREGVPCARYSRATESGKGRREFLLVSWEHLPVAAEDLQSIRNMEAAWMSALAGKEPTEATADGQLESRGFLIEERDFYGERVLWEVLRTMPRVVDADPQRFRLPTGPPRR